VRLTDSGSKKKVKKNNTNKINLDENGHRTPFRIPSMKGGSHQKTPTKLGLLDTAADYARIKSDSNMKNINKEVLINNGITISNLIEDCRVSITDLYVAGILTSFDDLIDLGFKPTDLTLNTELFNCASLVRLFKVNHNDMKAKRVEIDLEALMVGGFCSNDLEVIKFSIAPMIESGHIANKQLWALKYSFNDLLSLGLNKAHVSKLDISARRAVKRVEDGGWGWPKDYESLLPDTPKK
jgi:hypothetical protein